MVKCRGGGSRGRDGNWPLNGYRVLFWGDGNVLELDNSSGCTIL